MLPRALTWSFAATALVAAGCKPKAERMLSAQGARPSDSSFAPSGERPAFSFIDEIGWCDIDHRGLLIDLGTSAANGRYGWALATPQGIVPAEHEGATWARVYDPKLTINFTVAESTRLTVALRLGAQDARKASVAIDDVPVGQIAVPARAVKVAATAPTKLPVEAGLHQLTLRFTGKKGSDAEPYAEIDWIRIAPPDDGKQAYGAPTLFDVLAPGAEVGGVPRRAIAVRAPSTIACALRVPPRAELRASIGMGGDGKGAATIAVREDGAEPAVEKRVEVQGGEAVRGAGHAAAPAWTDVAVPLGRYAGRVVRIELSAVETGGSGRLMFGDPMLLVPDAPAVEVGKARAAVIVVLDGVERRDLPPWAADAPHAPNLKRLCGSAALFDDYRGAGTLANGAMASLLTGLPPRAHRLTDPGARLPKSLVTIGDVAREGSVRAAMFTGVPTTFAAFGFDSHWDAFVAYPPNADRPATAPIDDAAAWLIEPGEREAEARPLLAVVHARGGHPPWDVTPEEAAKLPPAKYAGPVRPRDSAQILARLHGRLSRLPAADAERLRAMYYAALYEQDAALGKLVRRLEDSGRWDSMLFIVTADVSSGFRSLFAEDAPLDEDALALPLYVHFPGGAFAGQRVSLPTSPADVTRTLLIALGLQPPPEIGGRDLAAVAAGLDVDAHRIRVAYSDRGYSARWGHYVLAGPFDARRPALCDLSLDPSCAYDRLAVFPIAGEALFRRLSDLDQRYAKAPEREPLSLDSETAAMLKVWGM